MKTPSLSIWKTDFDELLDIVLLSKGLDLNMVLFIPSNLLSPSFVLIQLNPFLSIKIDLISFEEISGISRKL